MLLINVSRHLKRGMNRSLNHLETEMVNCLKRRDEHWKKERSQVKTTSTPVSPRPFYHSFSDPGCLPSAIPSPTTPKPPINLEFSTFGQNRDVLEFIEKCENFLSLRQLKDVELLATVNAVLTGPARSWWAEDSSRIRVPLISITVR